MLVHSRDAYAAVQSEVPTTLNRILWEHLGTLEAARERSRTCPPVPRQGFGNARRPQPKPCK